MLVLLAGVMMGCTPSIDTCAERDRLVFFEDLDGDGHGNRDRYIIECAAFPGFVDDVSDCDDGNAAISPSVPERCDGLDNDCDGAVDEGFSFAFWYLDEDGDGVGSDDRVWSCIAEPGRVPVSGDCAPEDPAVFPGASEVCNGVDDDCDDRVDDDDPSLDLAGTSVYYRDLDGDGHGDPNAMLRACEQPPGSVSTGEDCDDTSPARNPDVFEICNGVDDDCDQLIDDSDPGILGFTQRIWFADNDLDGWGDPDVFIQTCTEPWYFSLDGTDCDDTDPEVGSSLAQRWVLDADGDGFGAGMLSGIRCDPPFPDWVPADKGVDCDDADAANAPGLPERCDGADNNCSGLVDDDDPLLDAALAPLWWVDADRDGFGTVQIPLCTPPSSVASAGGDCDDEDAFVFPHATELCNGVDDDCNGFIDDEDPFLDRYFGLDTYRDRDGDGFGDPFHVQRSCLVQSGFVAQGGDCDDQNGLVGPPTPWWADRDGDRAGAGEQSPPTCEPPGPGFQPVRGLEDCADEDPTVGPGAVERCEDGVDQDCDGVDGLCPRSTCLELLVDGLSVGDGPYALEPGPNGPRDVWCDMSTDGGGWTLVSSTTVPVDDARSAYSPNLASLAPMGAMTGIWDGLRDVTGPRVDLRFACKLDLLDEAFAVDLAFYEVFWYHELTAGLDADVCFNQDEGIGYDSPPARRNLLTGAVRERGNHWNAGYLEGEDQCADDGDFTIDFDDRGMDGNQNDGTDWGEDDFLPKCGRTNAGAAWFIYVR